MNHTTISTWVQRLEVLTRPLVLPSEAAERAQFISAFADGMGDRRPIDQPLLARMMNGPTHYFVHEERDDAATAVMRAVGRRDIAAIGALIREPHTRSPVPLVAEPSVATLEFETERELSAVHALASASLADPALAEYRPRVVGAAQWLIAEIQPDNATHRPWALHAFVYAAAVLEGSEAIDAEMYAQTLVHNAVVASSTSGGTIDIFSCILLRDAENVLKRLA